MKNTEICGARVDLALKKKLIEQAKIEGRTISSMIAYAVKTYLENTKK